MKSNPCRQCELKNQDKNNQICMNCDKRLEYVSHLERGLSYAITNTEQRPASPRLSTISKRSYVLLSLIHISEPTRPELVSRMPSSA